MKHSRVIDAIKKRYTTIDKVLTEVISDFESENIHLFRLEVKKLRSFLRLACKSKSKQKLPVKLQTFYNSLGVIRSLQIQQHCIEKLIDVEYSILVKSYSVFITLAINEQIRLTKKLINDTKSFKKERTEILKIIPFKLKRETIRKFTSHKLETLRVLMQPPSLSDESIHAVRKLLKDILYTWSFTKEETDLPTLVSMSKEEITSITKLLGAFQDKCVALDLLHAHYKKLQTDEKERTAWVRLGNKWWNEKETARKEIHSLFHKSFPLQLDQSISNGKKHLPLKIKLLKQ